MARRHALKLIALCAAASLAAGTSGCLTRGYAWSGYKRLPNLDRNIIKPYGKVEVLQLIQPFHFDGENATRFAEFTIDVDPGAAIYMGETNDWKYYRLEKPARFKYAREGAVVEQTEVAFILVTDGTTRIAWRPPEDRGIWIAAKLANPPKLIPAEPTP